MHNFDTLRCRPCSHFQIKMTQMLDMVLDISTVDYHDLASFWAY